MQLFFFFPRFRRAGASRARRRSVRTRGAVAALVAKPAGKAGTEPPQRASGVREPGRGKGARCG